MVQEYLHLCECSSRLIVLYPDNTPRNAGMVWDNLFKVWQPDYKNCRIGLVGVILRAAYDESSKNFLGERGWSDLKTRKAKHKAIKIFTISTGEAPSYLTDQFSKVEERNPYNIRNSDLNIYLPLYRKLTSWKGLLLSLVLNCGIPCGSQLILLQPLKKDYKI